MAQQYTWPPINATTSSPSTGNTGSAAPAYATEVGGVDGGGVLRALKVDTNGVLQVDLVTETLTPLATKDAADGTPGLAVPSVAIQVAGSDGTDLRALSTDATGKLNLNNISGTISLPTGASTSALQTQISGQLPATLGQKAMAASLAVAIASDQSTLPVSAASLPLPSGAATSANQTNGSQKSQIVDGSGNVISSQVSGTQRALDVGIDVAGVQVDPRQIRTLTSSDVVTAVQSTASSLNATVVQATGSNLHTVVDSGSIAATQSGTWSTRTEDGAGTAIGSNSVSSNVGLDVSDVGLIKANTPVYNDYTVTNITTSAYVQLIASTTSTTMEIELFDSSGQALYLAVGPAASEVNQMIIFPGGNGRVKLSIPSGSRVSAKAITATANSGFLAINLYS